MKKIVYNFTELQMALITKSQKLPLTDEQIEEICSEIPLNKAIPLQVATSIRNNILIKLENDLKKVSIYPKVFSKFKESIVKAYYTTLIAAGESVGILMAQSIGQSQTQTTLNAFHSCGLSIKTVVTGVPRFTELMNATKNPKMTNCLIFLNKSFTGNDDISMVRDIAGNSFSEVTLKRITLKTELIKDDQLEEWHYLFCELYNIDVDELDWRIRFHIDINLLYEYKITMKLIAEAIKKEYADAIVLYTPDWDGILDVFVEGLSDKNKENSVDIELKEELDEDTEEPEEPEEEPEEELEEFNEDDDPDEDVEKTTTNFVMKEKEILDIDIDKIITMRTNQKNIDFDEEIPEDIEKITHMEDKVLPALMTIKISGISGIKDIFFEKRKISQNSKEEEWIITTEGSNLVELYSHPLVDKQKTLCNNMWEIYQIFGIEAARQFLIEEYMDVLSSDGSFVNISNVEILVDIMTFTGTIISISRYGQKKMSTGPLAMASFEQSLDNFLNSGINGEKETTNGVSASIMLGKMPKVGTGIFDLCVDMKAFLPSLSSVQEVQEDDIKENAESKDEQIFTKSSFFSF
jgi:DNA-directed RNA polymerase beta' subunit